MPDHPPADEFAPGWASAGCEVAVTAPTWPPLCFERPCRGRLILAAVEGVRVSDDERQAGATSFVDPDRPPLVIGEVAQAHDGSLGTAHAYIDAIAGAGADAVKFQTHIAAAESSPGEPWRVRFSPQDETRYEYWTRMEFTEAQWHGLKEHADERGLLFLSSPFSIEAVELLTRVGVPAWKVASGETNNPVLLDALGRTGLPVIMSTGLSSFDDIGAAVDHLAPFGNEIVLMQCSTAYPCPPEAIGLNLLEELRARWDLPVGLSDHSGTIFPSIAATVLGASVLEVHVTMSRQAFGPDVVASVTVEELTELVRGTRAVHTMMRVPVDKDGFAAENAHLRTLFGRSAYAKRDLASGETLTADDMVFKKPGDGVTPKEAQRLTGRRLVTSVAAGDQLQLAHVGDQP